MKEKVILVDENDQEVGTGEKLRVHQLGQLHRAFSVFVLNKRGEILLQKRAQSKYHPSKLWSNTCCGHPRPREQDSNAARRRLKEEMGFGCRLKEIFSFVYKVQLGEHLFEHEYDHVFIGEFNGASKPNPAEVEATRWIKPGALQKEIKKEPEKYTYWLRIIVENPFFHRKKG